MAGVCPSGKSLLGSIGGCPPFGEARVNSTPASRKTKYGAANSSSQNPVLRPVLPRTSCDVSTINIFTSLLLCRDWPVEVIQQAKSRECACTLVSQILSYRQYQRINRHHRVIEARPGARLN